MRRQAPGRPTVSIVLRIVFSIVLHCSCAGGFSLAIAMPCIVIGAHFSLQIDCIFLQPSPRQKQAGPAETTPFL
jgi:hypothetical protein